MSAAVVCLQAERRRGKGIHLGKLTPAICGGWWGRSLAPLLGLLVSVPAAAQASTVQTPCADVNLDGVVDQGDITRFVELFLDGDLSGDLNGDGFLDLGDLNAFVEAFLQGTACPPQMLADGGMVQGSLARTGTDRPQFLSETWLREPGQAGAFAGYRNNTPLLGVGSDSDKNTVTVAINLELGALVLDRDALGREELPLRGDGISAPSDLFGLDLGEPDWRYEPVSARVHDGLVILQCSAARLLDAASPGLMASWDEANAVALLWKNLDDNTWQVVRDVSKPTLGDFGGPWSLGMPMLLEPGRLLLGWADYQWKIFSNGPNTAYLSEFVRDADGRWTHQLTLELLEDGSAPSEQHFHVVQPHWTGTQLRLFIAIGDNVSQNGIYEIYRDDLDLAAGAVPKAGATNVHELGTGWTEAGFIHGGQFAGMFHHMGLQPTVMLPLDGRMHCGADEDFSAIVSFDPNRPGGTPIDDIRVEYLGVEPDMDSGLGWLALSGDVDDYASPRRGMMIVQPSVSWTGLERQATRVVFFEDGVWSSAGVVDTKMNSGAGLGPDGLARIGSLAGLQWVQAGPAKRFTPLIPSIAVTNAIQNPAWTVQVRRSERATATLMNPVSDPSEASVQVGPPPGSAVWRIETKDDTPWRGLTIAELLPPVSDWVRLSEGDTYQVRFWIRPVGDLGLNMSFVPMRADTWQPLMVGDSGRPLAMTERGVKLQSHQWVEFLQYGRVLLPLDDEAVGLGLQLQTRSLNDSMVAQAFEIVMDGIYLNPSDFVGQRPGVGEALPSTQHSFSLARAALPVVVRGLTLPLGTSGEQVPYRRSRTLAELRIDDDNYVRVDAFFTNSTARLAGRVDGEFFTGPLASVEWTRGTEVQIRFADEGPDLAVQISFYGGPWSEPQVVEGLGGRSWNELRMFGSAGEGHLAVGAIEASLPADTPGSIPE